MAKKQLKQQQPEAPKQLIWKDTTYTAGDTFLISLPEVGLKQEAQLMPSFYSYGSFISMNMSLLNWCNVAITLKPNEGKAEMKWWRNEWYLDQETGMYTMGKHKDSPFQHCPSEIWHIPIEITGNQIHPVGAASIDPQTKQISLF